jgi:hypothetical protein
MSLSMTGSSSTIDTMTGNVENAKIAAAEILS